MEQAQILDKTMEDSLVETVICAVSLRFCQGRGDRTQRLILHRLMLLATKAAVQVIGVDLMPPDMSVANWKARFAKETIVAIGPAWVNSLVDDELQEMSRIAPGAERLPGAEINLFQVINIAALIARMLKHDLDPRLAQLTPEESALERVRAEKMIKEDEAAARLAAVPRNKPKPGSGTN